MARLTREQSQALTREKLLRSALDIVARDGYEGASVERIAEEAGFSKGAFYSNFASKEDILQQLLEGNAGNDVKDLGELLLEVSDPDEVIDLVARWGDKRAQEQKWGIVAIEFMRRARRDGALGPEQEKLFTPQWEGVGRLLLDKLLGDTSPSATTAIRLGEVVLELTYGGISGFLRVNTTGEMVRYVLNAVRDAERQRQDPAKST